MMEIRNGQDRKKAKRNFWLLYLFSLLLFGGTVLSFTNAFATGKEIAGAENLNSENEITRRDNLITEFNSLSFLLDKLRDLRNQEKNAISGTKNQTLSDSINLLNKNKETIDIQFIAKGFTDSFYVALKDIRFRMAIAYREIEALNDSLTYRNKQINDLQEDLGNRKEELKSKTDQIQTLIVSLSASGSNAKIPSEDHLGELNTYKANLKSLKTNISIILDGIVSQVENVEAMYTEVNKRGKVTDRTEFKGKQFEGIKNAVTNIKSSTNDMKKMVAAQ